MSRIGQRILADTEGNPVGETSGALDVTIKEVKDFESEVLKGNVEGYSIMKALGEFEGGEVDVAGEDVIRSKDFTPDGPVRLPTPDSAGEQMTVVSESVNDAAAGTGIQTARIHYLDATGAEETEDVAMNGTTDVDTVATDMRFINDFYALTVGSGGVAAGAIGIYKKGGSIADDLYNMIAAGGNKSLVPHRMVPVGKTLILKEWYATEAQGKRSAFRIRSTDMNGVLIPGVFCFKGTAYMKQDCTAPIRINDIIPALSIVKVSHWDDQAGAEGSCCWWGYLVDD